MERRVFLGLVAGLPLAGCRPDPRPAWLDGALARLAEEKKPGLVVVLPEDRGARHDWGHVLVQLLNSPDPDLRELFAEAQPLCLERAAARTNLYGLRPQDDLVLIDAQGYAIAGTPFTPRLSDPPATFIAAVRPLVRGADGGRLRARAAEVPLASREREEVEPAALPYVISERLKDPASPQGLKLRAAIERYVQGANPAAPGPRLPYGIVAGAPAGCGDDCEESDRSVAIDCGMGRVTPGSRAFLKFIAR